MPVAKTSSVSTNRSKARRLHAQQVLRTHRASLSRQSLLFALLLFFSGTAALIYQIVWVRQLSLVVGVEVYSITIAVSAFFAGLAGGGALFGRLVDRSGQPLRLYALLELSVAITAVIATIMLAHSAALFVSIQSKAGIIAWLLPFLLVGSPAFLMGGTLPVAIRSLARNFGEVAAIGGWVYAANTAGGVAGALLSSFAFLPWLGVRSTAFAAAGLNLLAAAVALFLSRQAGLKRAPVSIEGKSTIEGTPHNLRLIAILYAVSGGIALGYEVVWSQAIAQFVSTRAFAFSIVLATYLAGLMAGSALYARFFHRVRAPWGLFGLLIAGAGAIALLEITSLGLWQLQIQYQVGRLVLAATGSEFAQMSAQFVISAFGLLFLPTVLLGAAFPAALRLASGTARIGREVGSLVAFNIAGGIAGTLFTGFVLIPQLGIVRTLSLLAISAVAVGGIAVTLGTEANHKAQWAVAFLGLVVIAAVFLTPVDRLARLLLSTRGGGSLAFYEEGRGATVAVAQQRNGDHVFRRLFVQGVSNSGDAMPSMRYMRLQAMVPLLVHDGEPQSVMVVGFGTGITAGETLRYPGLERRVCAELLPPVVRAGQMFPENYRAWSDSNIQVRLRDGRQELMQSREQYDVITLEPPPPSSQGVSNLYSTEFYELAKKRLAPKGIFAQWLPIATQNVEETRALVRSFLDVFPYATLWTTELHEMLLVGSVSPIRIDAQKVEERFAPQSVVSSLKAVGIDSPAALLATWVTGREGLEKFAADTKPVTDDRPGVEYGPWVRSGEITRVLPEMLSLGTDVPIEGAEEAFRAQVQQKRAVLLDFYKAGLAAYGGDRTTWEGSMSRVNAAEPDNPYYHWISGGE